jgi:Bacterial antitoxin of type II TA system, VapB
MESLTDCGSYNDLRRIFNSADRVITRQGNAVCVFNPGHGKNAYRLIGRLWFAYAWVVCHTMCGGSHMATNLSLDPVLIERALELSGERTKKAAVTRALKEFIARREQKRLLELMGKLEWDTAFDYKAERSRS